MSKKFAKTDTNGIPVALYDDEINTVPSEAVEISIDTWKELIENQGKRKLVNGKPVKHTPTVDPDLDIINQIRKIEANITVRRIREYVLGIDNGWLEKLEKEIEGLRKKLK